MSDWLNMQRCELDINSIINLAYDKTIKNFMFLSDRIIHSGIVDEFVTVIDSDDELLLQKSIGRFSFFNCEYMQIKLHTKCQSVLKSKMIRGTKKSVSNAQEIKNLSYDLIFKANKQGLEIDYIEIAHTHLGEQYLVLDNDSVTRVVSKGLSRQDVETIFNIKPFIQSKILLKCICENGVAYCKYF